MQLIRATPLLLASFAACHPQPSCPPFDTGAQDASLDDAAPRLSRVLIYSGLTGFRHESIPTAVESLASHFHDDAGIESDRVSDTAALTPDRFDAYGAVVFISTTGEPLGPSDSELNRSLLAYVRAGGGFVGVHAVDDAYDGCGRFNAVVGGWFAGHPGDLRMNTCVTHGTHPALGRLPAMFAIEDEFHLLWNFRGDNEVLVTCATDDGTGSMPISWVRNEGAGRVFVTTLGHPDAAYADPNFMDHVVAGTEWVLRRR